MADPLQKVEEVPEPDVSGLITEDDTPAESWFQERQMRLLTEPLYASWSGPGEGRPFLAAADVGIYAGIHETAVVPDVMLCLDVRPPENFFEKRHRCYLIWEFGVPPSVVIEIVSGDQGARRRSFNATPAWALPTPPSMIWRDS